MKTKLELIELKERLLKEIKKTHCFNNDDVINLMNKIDKKYLNFFEESQGFCLKTKFYEQGENILLESIKSEGNLSANVKRHLYDTIETFFDNELFFNKIKELGGNLNKDKKEKVLKGKGDNLNGKKGTLKIELCPISRDIADLHYYSFVEEEGTNYTIDDVYDVYDVYDVEDIDSLNMMYLSKDL